MSTRCHVVKKENNIYKGIYIHFDGYVKGGVGETLYHSYNSEQAVDTLLALGDISFLGETLVETKTYADRGEDCPAYSTTNFTDFLDDDYCYVWNNGKYLVYHWDEYLGELSYLLEE